MGWLDSIIDGCKETLNFCIDVGGKGIDKFNSACRYMRHSTDFLPSLSRGVYKVCTFAVDIAGDAIIKGIGLTMDTVGYLTSDSYEDWERKKRDATELLMKGLDDTIKKLNKNHVNTELVGNLIDIACMIPCVRGIGKTAKELRTANKIQQEAYQTATKKIADLNSKLSKHKKSIGKEMEYNIHQAMESNVSAYRRSQRIRKATEKGKRKNAKFEKKNQKDVRKVKKSLYKTYWNSFSDFFKSQCMVRFDDWKTRIRDYYQFVGRFLADYSQEELEERANEDDEISKIMDEISKKSDEQIKDSLMKYVNDLRRNGQNELADLIEEIIKPKPPEINLKGCVGAFFGDYGSCIPFDYTNES